MIRDSTDDGGSKAYRPNVFLIAVWYLGGLCFINFGFDGFLLGTSFGFVACAMTLYWLLFPTIGVEKRHVTVKRSLLPLLPRVLTSKFPISSVVSVTVLPTQPNGVIIRANSPSNKAASKVVIGLFGNDSPEELKERLMQESFRRVGK